MIRLFACSCALLAVVFVLAGDSTAAGKAKKKNQMVAGTIKSVDVEKNVLVVSQKLKGEKVDRELTITEDVEFMVAGKTAAGRNGLELLKDRIGANVKVKCDKDVNVLKVTVK